MSFNEPSENMFDILQDACNIFMKSFNAFGFIKIVNSNYKLDLTECLYFKNLSKRIELDILIKYFHETFCYILYKTKSELLQRKVIIHYQFNDITYPCEFNKIFIDKKYF